MPNVNYPSALAFASWDKQARSLKKTKPITDLGEALKSLAKGHDAIDFGVFDAAKSATAADAEKRGLQLGAEAKKVRACADAAKALETQAKKLEAELKKDKQPPDAASAVAKAAAPYGAEMLKLEQAGQALQAEASQRAAQLKAAAKAEPKSDPELDKLEAKVKARVLAGLKLAMKPDAEPVPFMLGIGQKGCIVSMGRSVSASEKNVLMKLMTDDSGVKYHLGICTFEKKGQVFTFEGDSLPAGAGLGKKLQKGLQLQVAKKLRVRVRKPGGPAEEGEAVEQIDSFDDVDESVAEAVEAEAAGGDPKVAEKLVGAAKRFQGALGRLAGMHLADNPVAKEVNKRVEAARQALAERQADLAEKLVDQVVVIADKMKAKVGVGEAEASAAAAKVEAVIDQARGRLKGLVARLDVSGVLATAAAAQIKPRIDAAEQALKDRLAEAALKMIDQLEIVTQSVEQKVEQKKAAAAAQGGATAAQGSATAGKAASGKPAAGAKVVFTQSRLKWDGARNKVQSELKKLEETILERAKGEADFDAIAAKTRKLSRILETLDTELIDRLDDAYTATTAADEARANDQARELIRKYLSFVETDPLLKVIDDNPFGKYDVRGSVHATLTDLQSKFAAAAG
jgi:hypothetical protein